MAMHGVVRSTAKEQPADMNDMNDITFLDTTSYNTSYLPLPAWHAVFLFLILTVMIPQAYLCFHRDGRPLSSAGSVRPFGWLHLVKSVTHRAAAHVGLAAPLGNASLKLRMSD